jgi:hypothetical protein
MGFELGMGLFQEMFHLFQRVPMPWNRNFFGGGDVSYCFY